MGSLLQAVLFREQDGEPKEACAPVDRIRLNDRELEAGVVKGLRDAGYIVDVAPGIGLDVCGRPVQEGSIISVYKRRGRK